MSPKNQKIKLKKVKGGIISAGIFILVQSSKKKEEPNYCLSTFQSALKGWGIVIWFDFLRKGPN